MKILLVGINAKYIHTNNAIRLLKANSDFDIDLIEFTIKDDIDEIFLWIIFGIIIGARLGYILFYNFNFYFNNPISIFSLWEGGMSFHGGAAGVIIAIALYSWKKNKPFLELGDVICSVVPIGLFFGRIANFINGELWGKVTTAPWGIIFPKADQSPRHPSQLYEAGLEGVLLGLAMYLCWRRGWLKATGRLTGLFLFGYGLARFLVELVRQPDAHIGLLAGGLSMGQILSLPMMLLGLYLLRRILRPSHDQSHDKGGDHE